MIRALIRDTLGWLGWGWGQRVVGIASRHRRWNLSGPLLAIDMVAAEYLSLRADLRDFSGDTIRGSTIALYEPTTPLAPPTAGTVRFADQRGMQWPDASVVATAPALVLSADGDVDVYGEDELFAIGGAADIELTEGLAMGGDAIATHGAMRCTMRSFSTTLAANVSSTVFAYDAGTDDAEIIAVARVIARHSGLGAGTECAGYVRRSTFKVRGGTTTLIGSGTSVTHEDDAGWDCVLGVNGDGDLAVIGTADSGQQTAFKGTITLYERRA